MRQAKRMHARPRPALMIGLALLAIGLILLMVALSINPGEVVDGDTTKADDGEPAGSGATALVTAIAGLISSVAGLITALTGLLALRRQARVEPPSPPA